VRARLRRGVRHQIFEGDDGSCASRLDRDRAGVARAVFRRGDLGVVRNCSDDARGDPAPGGRRRTRESARYEDKGSAPVASPALLFRSQRPRLAAAAIGNTNLLDDGLAERS
jgi:hypothetical protein